MFKITFTNIVLYGLYDFRQIVNDIEQRLLLCDWFVFSSFKFTSFEHYIKHYTKLYLTLFVELKLFIQADMYWSLRRTGEI